VTRAYAALVDAGYAEARRGSGTYTRVPGGRARAHDRALMPRAGEDGLLDLSCAASTAPPQLAAAYADAVRELPAYLGGTGYFPTGLPALQEVVAARYTARGLPTEPGQVMVTAGALSATTIVARACSGPRDRVLVESPTYPNAVAAIRSAGARPVVSPVDPTGWDLDATEAVVSRARPRLAYLIPDFHNPTGHLLDDAGRERYAALLARAGTVAVVDEAHQGLALEDGLAEAMPLPFAAHAPETITLGSASKAFWGGLRLGWIRVPRGGMEALVDARVGVDLGAPVLEQLVLASLLRDADEVLAVHRRRLREQRDALAAAVTRHLPQWRFVLPRGGLALWCELPDAAATALATEAERLGLVVTPGPVFSVEGGLDRFVRVPWTRPVAELEESVARLARAWETASHHPAPATRRPGRVLVA
jgi:DNA-binding transcriptional MocR family regulator